MPTAASCEDAWRLSHSVLLSLRDFAYAERAQLTAASPWEANLDPLVQSAGPKLQA
jgi:hypothetical protein